jgi:hypothetical protein
MSEADDTALGAELGDGADHTAVIPDNTATEAAQLAWSMADNAPDVTSAAERQPLPLALRILLGCVALAAVTLVASQRITTATTSSVGLMVTRRQQCSWTPECNARAMDRELIAVP